MSIPCGKRFYEDYEFLPRYFQRTSRLTTFIASALHENRLFCSTTQMCHISPAAVNRILDIIFFVPTINMGRKIPSECWGLYLQLVLCQEKVQIKSNQFSLCLAKLNLLFLSHYLLDFSDILPHIGLGINTRNGCEYVLYCKMFLCIQKSTYMHVYN